MSRNYKIRNQEKLYFLSFATVNWVDVFVRLVYKDIVVGSLNYCTDQKGLEVYSWCIMSSHVHLIIGTKGENKLEGIVRDLKKHTSKVLIKAIAETHRRVERTGLALQWMLWMFERAGKRNINNTKYQFWQQHNQPIELNNNFIMQQKLDYIHRNPVEAGFVREAEGYPYSSAIDYAGGKGLVKLVYLE
jgi:putative transposase